MNSSAQFWDRISERYSKRPISDPKSYEIKLDVTRGYFRPDMNVLEFGCGTGSTALLHAPYVKHILAIDISAKMIEIAQNKAKSAGVTNVQFHQSSFDDLDVSNQSFDVVLGLNILHLVEDKAEVLAKVHKILKPDGLFVSSTACLGDTMNFLKFIFPIGKFLRLMPSVKVFKTSELVDSLLQADFDIDHQWQPARGKPVFIVARKTSSTITNSGPSTHASLYTK